MMSRLSGAEKEHPLIASFSTHAPALAAVPFGTFPMFAPQGAGGAAGIGWDERRNGVAA